MSQNRQIDVRELLNGYDNFLDWAWPRKREAEAEISDTIDSTVGQSGSFGLIDSSECASSSAFSTVTDLPAASSTITSRIAMWCACMGIMKFFTKSASFISALLDDYYQKELSAESAQKGKSHD